MTLHEIHRRLVILMCGAALTAFAAGAGVEVLSAVLAFLALGVAFVWNPSPAVSERIGRLGLPLALLLAARVGLHALVLGGDVVVPVVDLLLLLLCSEALRSTEDFNEVRLYALTLALLLAATAYRPGAVFGLSFAVYVALASVALPMGVLRRKSQRFGQTAPSPNRALVLPTLALSTVTLLAAVTVFLTFPRVARGWGNRGDVMASSIAGFGDQISIGEVGSRIYGNPQVVLRVEFPDGLPPDFLGLHWRGRSYDRFDGIRWTRTEGVRPSSARREWYREKWEGPVVRQEIYAAPLDVRVLFALHPMVDVEAEAGIQPMFDNVGDYFYWGSTTPVYTAWSMAGRPPADSLRSAERGFMPDRERYLQLPRLPARIHALADSLTRGLDSRYDRTVAIESFLRGEFDYTRELPASTREATLDHFLFERRAGHCEYFSTAMVVLLRSLGIQARNVNGFLGGRWNDFGGYLAVTQNEAHSWVEVWFPNHGWVQFDPTPGGSSGGEVEAGWNWPGRFWFDGLQHRWNKWILDYSLDAQLGLFDRARDWVGGTSDARTGQGRRIPPWVWGLLVLPAVVLAAMRLRGGGPVAGAAARRYLALVRSARKAGVVTGEVTPFQVARAIGERVPDAGAAAIRAVELYTRSRFGGDELTDVEKQDFKDAVRRVRKELG
ncbi:MAG: transglutaminaseTgpA domain-containing protein [Gemmatimonadota bacterium]|jgi:transglutaminase-like putative cysteine protease